MPHFFADEIVCGFKLVHPLKAGADGEVWGAVAADGLPRVLKFRKSDSRGAARFAEISRILFKCDCPYIGRIARFAENVHGYHCAVCEYYSNGTLAKLLASQRKPTLANTVHIMECILIALDAIEKNGIVHRDIKPANILFDTCGNPHLCDFSIAKIVGIDERRGEIFGTAQYMSPEQSADSSLVDARSDIFGLSSLLFELVTGKPRFAAGEFSETLKAVLSTKKKIEVDALAKFVPTGLARLVSSMSEYSPDKRPQSAAEILRALDGMNLPKSRVEF